MYSHYVGLFHYKHVHFLSCIIAIDGRYNLSMTGKVYIQNCFNQKTYAYFNVTHHWL